jgi:hypothetical protein
MAAGEYVTQAQMLPGGEALLLSIVKEGETGNIDANEIAVYSLTSRTRTKLSVTGADARWLATGHLVYAFQGRLYGASFDPKRLTLGSDPVPVVDGVALSVSGGVGNVAAWADYSANGWLAYVPGSSTAALAVDLVRIDRATGVTQALKLPPFASSFPRISPDGQRIAFQVDSGRDSQVWIYWLDRRAEPTQLTYEGRNRFPIWSWDSRRVVFQSDRDNDLGLFWQRADGGDAPKRLTTADKGTAHMPESWRPKSDEFSYSVTSDAGATIHLHSTGTGRSTRFGDIRSERPLSPLNSAFSPDGDWLAYTIRGAGGVSVWVHPFPFTGASMRKIPDDGAHHPLFAANPLELFYLGAVAGASRVASVKVNAGFELTGIRESTVFSPTTPTLPRNYDVSVDGRFFIAVALRDDQRASEIRIVQHWSEELRAKVRRG